MDINGSPIRKGCQHIDVNPTYYQSYFLFQFNWTEHITTIFKDYDIEISKDTHVVVLSSDSYIEDMIHLIKATPKRYTIVY